MKKILILIFLAQSIVYRAQTITENQKPFIELTGTAETEVVPDEIYLSILLMERPENREKLDIKKQEESLKQSIKELGIDQANLTLSEAYADFRKIKTLKKDVIISKSYILKINSAGLLSKVYEKLDKINAQDAYISRVSHSKLIELTKENRIKAIKAAKEKVDYLLAAAGQQAGKPLQILETGNDLYQPFNGGYMPRMALKNVAMAEDAAATEDIEFKKIKITSSYLVRYEITPTK